ncbi:MAG: 2-hydroxyacyl-CoA dehydratase family protein [Solirubrobacteraceae bacterium]
MADVQASIAALSAVAENPQAYAEEWKRRNGSKVIGIFPMNFPAELIHAAGALPVVVQEDRAQITAGRKLLYEYYCAYTRSIADQAATEKLEVFDAFFFVDHCVALLGAVDAMRYELPDKPMLTAQYTASMDEAWTAPMIRKRVESLRQQLEEFVEVEISLNAISNSIRLFNHNRQLLRQVYDLRRTGRTGLTSTQMQVLVKSSMVMDIEEHTEILSGLMDGVAQESGVNPELVKLHLSGHFCHAPHPELLDAIEECGAVIVDDDLYTGFRYISTDVPGGGDPLDALTEWYFDRNVTVPCATRVQNNVDWDRFLLDSVAESGAAGVIVLMAKFCEPHMLYYPELRKALDRSHVPHLLIETEHEGLPIETVRTRVETFLARIRRVATPALATA